MTDLSSLIERLEKATGPDSELDADIAIALNVIPSREWWSFNYIKSSILGRYTASTDAAILLAERVLPYESILMGMRQTEKTIPWARIGNLSPSDNTAPTLALALVLATLRAVQSKGPEA